MSKHRTTVWLDSDLRAARKKLSDSDGRPMTYHDDKALRAYGPIKKLLAKGCEFSEPLPTGISPVPIKGGWVEKERAAKKRSFTKPSVDELAVYFLELGSMTCNDDANSFFDHFESNGWLISGRAKMRCWKSACRNWSKNKVKFAPKGKEVEGAFAAKHNQDGWADGL